jgi:tetratricopeptide (TPR) repeat protein
MRSLWILPLAILLLGATPLDPAEIDRQFNEGQRLFGEKDFAGALKAFETVDEYVPNEPRVYSWIGACLNELGRYQEAEERLEDAFSLLRGIQGDTPIDLGYYTLLAGIQANLGEYEQAVATLESYRLPQGGDDPAKAEQALASAKQTLAAKMVAAGGECLRTGNLDCARVTFTQADALLQATPSVREAMARDLLVKAAKAPDGTDEEKAKKKELEASAIAATRLWVETAGDRAPEANRLLAKALVDTKEKEAYAEAIGILTRLQQEQDPAKPDATLLLDLAVAQGGLEQWDEMVASSSRYIELEPNDSLGKGHCLRSFAQFQLGKCQETVDDGAQCRNPDGSPRSLTHVDACKQRFAKIEALKDAAQEQQRRTTIARKCGYLHEKLKWARGAIGGIALDDLVSILQDYTASESDCRAYLESHESGFKSPMPQLCAAGVETTSSPANLAMQSKETLEALREQTRKYLTLCRGHLDAGQTKGVEGGLLKIATVLERHQVDASTSGGQP